LDIVMRLIVCVTTLLAFMSIGSAGELGKATLKAKSYHSHQANLHALDAQAKDLMARDPRALSYRVDVTNMTYDNPTQGQHRYKAAAVVRFFTEERAPERTASE
jgi:hypothetical protein